MSKSFIDDLILGVKLVMNTLENADDALGLTMDASGIIIEKNGKETEIDPQNLDEDIRGLLDKEGGNSNGRDEED